MNVLTKILIFGLMLSVFASCSKFEPLDEVMDDGISTSKSIDDNSVIAKDPRANDDDSRSITDPDEEDFDADSEATVGATITDPDEEDFDADNTGATTITDPDEEDFDADNSGATGITDPDEEDFDAGGEGKGSAGNNGSGVNQSFWGDKGNGTNSSNNTNGPR